METRGNNRSSLRAHLGSLRETFARRINGFQRSGNTDGRLYGFADMLAGRRAWPARFPNGATPDGLPWQAGEASYHLLATHEAVARCVGGVWNVPPFQRSFVWSAAMVRDLAESLWRDYPVGQVVLWQDRRAGTSDDAPLWVVDGQQRLTALCALFGSTPHWQRGPRAKRWEKQAKECAVFFDPRSLAPPLFSVGRPGGGRLNDELVALSAILEPAAKGRAESSLLEQLHQRTVRVGRLSAVDREKAYQRLLRVRELRYRLLPVTVVTHQLADITEMYERLSGGGMRFRRLILRALSQALRARWRCLSTSDS